MAKPNWKNKTIWTGDNLDIMRGMNSKSVDLIYLDPPFNSNHNYAAPIGSKAAGAAFKDTWTLNDIDKEWHGIIADTEPKLYTAIHMTGEVHGKSMKSYLIYMAIRLLEMERILKPMGSIYLHCDDTASHYLKVMMDAIFGKDNFRNNISWVRSPIKGAKATSKQFGRNIDSILFYSKSNISTFNQTYKPYDLNAKHNKFKHSDSAGRIYSRDNPLGDYSAESIKKFEADGLIYTTKNGKKQLIRYLDETKGLAVGSIWDDIKPINQVSKERTGYPTQKPLILLDRIIKASSNKGDIVFDPFCGCATTCVAADMQQREWIGIDISETATKLVRTRIKAEGGLFGEIIPRDDIPKRTDNENIKKYNSKDNKLFLYGAQDGICVGCETYFPYRNMSIDHIMPQSKGGGDNIENLQILCGACNSQKSTKTQAEWLVYRKELGL